MEGGDTHRLRRSLEDREGENSDAGSVIHQKDVIIPETKIAKLRESTSSDDEEKGRDPGKAEYKEFSKALRALHDLTSEPDDSRAGEEEGEHIERLREMTGRLRELCSQAVGDGEVPNPFKLLQIHLKHIFMHSEKIKDEDNVKTFLNGLEDGSATRSDHNNSVFMFLAMHATELWYQWNEEQQQWYWSPDKDNHMPCSTDVVTGGQWEGEIPAPENVEIISYLNTIRPIPSDEQYIPSLEFDVLTILKYLSRCDDQIVCESVMEIVKLWRAVGVQTGSTSKYVQMWMDELSKGFPENRDER